MICGVNGELGVQFSDFLKEWLSLHCSFMKILIFFLWMEKKLESLKKANFIMNDLKF